MRIVFPLGLLGTAMMIQAGCGAGSVSGDYEQATAQGTAPYAIVDLEARTIDYRSEIPDLDGGAYRSRFMVFRRLISGGLECHVGIFEVTQGQWRRLKGTTPWMAVDTRICSAAAHADDRPAYNLSRLDVLDAAASCTLPGSWRLDLPTEAEWIAACGATTSAGPTGTAVARETVITVERLEAGGGMDTGGPATAGSRTANELGYYDLLGNVWEWTQEGETARGGSWFDPLRSCRVDRPAGTGVTDGIDHALIGARLVLRP